MKKRCAQLYIIGMLLAVSAPMTAMTFHAQTEPIGNETEVMFPATRTADGAWNINYFSELGDWFESHFAFRAELVSLNSRLQNTLFGTSTSDSVIAGTDGWLYYAATLDDYQHNNNVSERTLFNEAHNLALYQEQVESAGATFLFTIAPNKNTLYGDNMPQNTQIQVAEESDYERLIPYLTAEGVHYVELRDLFESGEDSEALYYARDSHWNETGAVMVYNALLDAADVDHETYEDVEPAAVRDYYGDLADMLYPDSRFVEPETRLVYLEEPHWTYTSETSSVEENLITTSSEDGHGTLLMYRDSFGNSLLPYMAEAFESAVFSKNEPLDGTDLTTYTPDVVIYEKVERHLPTLSSVPAMITGPVRYEGLQEIEREIAEDYESGTTCEQSQTSGYTMISGVAAGDVVGDETRIYVAVTDAAGTVVYEAYTINTSTADGESDDGYLLYLDADALDGEIENIRVYAVNADTDGEETMTAIYVLDEAAAAAEEAALAEAETAVEPADPEEPADETEAAEADPTEEKAAGDTETVEEAAEATTEDADETIESGSERPAAQTSTSSAAQSTTTSKTDNSTSKKDSGTSKTTTGSSAGSTSKASTTTTSQPASTATQTPAAAETPAVPETPAATETPAVTETPAATQTPAATETPAAQAPAATTPAAPAARYEVSRVFVEDCGYDSGYWDITYSDGSHEYIDVP